MSKIITISREFGSGGRTIGKENKMAVMSVNKLFLNMGVPIIWLFSKIVINQVCGTSLIWTSFVITEILSVFCFCLLYVKS